MRESIPKVCSAAEEAIVLALNVYRTRCHLCGRRLSRHNLGYLRVRRGTGVELALCSECLRELADADPGGV